MSSRRFLPGTSPLERLPMETLEVVAQFCGGVAGVSPSEEADVFTHDIINPYLDSAAANTWQPAYTDLKSLTLTSKTLYNPAQRALFKVAMVKSTGHLMRLIRSLLLYPENRRYVRCFVAAITDHVRPLPIRFFKPQPLGLPRDSFFNRAVPLLQETFEALNRKFKFSLSLIDTTPVNLHTLEDQLLTATLQLMPNVTATRICFGTPIEDQRTGRAGQTPLNPPMYASLLDNDHLPRLKALTLDFGALLSLTNIKTYVSGYPVGLPPSIERLTLVGIDRKSKLPYHSFTLKVVAEWLSTNKRLRELRILHGFDQLVTHWRFRNNQVWRLPENWNSVLLRYKDTLEVLVLESYPAHGFSAQLGFGRSGMLDCLSHMNKLRYLKTPLNALSGDECALTHEESDSDVTSYMRTVLPPCWKKIDVMIRSPLQCGADGEVMPATWRMVGFQRKDQLVEMESSETV